MNTLYYYYSHSRIKSIEQNKGIESRINPKGKRTKPKRKKKR